MTVLMPLGTALSAFFGIVSPTKKLHKMPSKNGPTSFPIGLIFAFPCNLDPIQFLDSGSERLK